ncbi:putative type I restriction-modification system specificity subunit [Selenomonas ruminantium subsp. lactilytica TAM6421]|uniref:Putative type I restriction-modification system specificity subunit n=2 Tax=Selenomonas ruminantium TaxID=971 RepID=I0GSH2_SELRL|nr:putative type I restriction-modification system specificity subunit [Selenomonas ruminantium subsp. lactilytica TAM6421]
MMNKTETKTLYEVTEIIMGQSPDSESYNDKGEGIPFYQGKSDFGEVYPTVRMYCTSPKKIAMADDILMSVRAPIGDVNIAQEECCIGRGLAAIRPKENINLKYLFYLLDYYKERLAEQGTGSTFKAIGKDVLKDFNVPIWPFEKQQWIADIIDEIQELIFNRKEAITVLDNLVKSRFIEMFGDPVTNPMGWERIRLADKCEIVTGNTPSRKVKEYYGNDIEWIKSDNITEATNLTTATEYLSDEGAKVGRIVEAGSILMTCIAGSLRSIGNVAIVDRAVAFNQQINAILPNEQSTYFMYEQFRLSKEYICSGVNMALKGILSKGQLSEIEFIFPPVELQKQFADFVSITDKSKLAIQQSIETLQTLKAKLMQDYFG